MALVLPFRALRFVDTDIASVVAPPYDVIGPKERAKFGAKSPHNIVHLDLPEGEGDARYENAARLLGEWRKSGALVREDEPGFLVYEQTFSPPGGGAQVTRRGFFALVRTEPYEARVVLPHERTLSGPKEDRYKLFCATKTALSPVFLLFRDPSGAASSALRETTLGSEFRTGDGITHRMARVTDPATCRAISAALANEQLLIADGHHRYETTLRYGAMVDAEERAAGREPLANGAHRYVLAFLSDADDPGLVVFPTHRLVHSLPSFSPDKLLEGASALFTVTRVPAVEVDAFVAQLAKLGEKAPSLGLVFPNGEGALLSLRPDAPIDSHPALSARPAVLRRMDVVLLHSGLLESVCGITIEQQAKQENLAYYKVARDAVADLKAGKGQFLALMNGTPVADVRSSCEAGEVMPQKSTFFYPKVPTGLLLHDLDPRQAIEKP